MGYPFGKKQASPVAPSTIFLWVNPVVLLSASLNIKNLAEQAGADDTIEKPFTINHLRAIVQ